MVISEAVRRELDKVRMMGRRSVQYEYGWYRVAGPDYMSKQAGKRDWVVE